MCLGTVENALLGAERGLCAVGGQHGVTQEWAVGSLRARVGRAAVSWRRQGRSRACERLSVGPVRAVSSVLGRQRGRARGAGRLPSLGASCSVSRVGGCPFYLSCLGFRSLPSSVRLCTVWCKCGVCGHRSPVKPPCAARGLPPRAQLLRRTRLSLALTECVTPGGWACIPARTGESCRRTTDTSGVLL